MEHLATRPPASLVRRESRKVLTRWQASSAAEETKAHVDQRTREETHNANQYYKKVQVARLTENKDNERKLPHPHKHSHSEIGPSHETDGKHTQRETTHHHSLEVASSSSSPVPISFSQGSDFRHGAAQWRLTRSSRTSTAFRTSAVFPCIGSPAGGHVLFGCHLCTDPQLLALCLEQRCLHLLSADSSVSTASIPNGTRCKFA